MRAFIFDWLSLSDWWRTLCLKVFTSILCLTMVWKHSLRPIRVRLCSTFIRLFGSAVSPQWTSSPECPIIYSRNTADRISTGWIHTRGRRYKILKTVLNNPHSSSNNKFCLFCMYSLSFTGHCFHPEVSKMPNSSPCLCRIKYPGLWTLAATRKRWSIYKDNRLSAPIV